MKSHDIADELGQHGLLSEAGLLIQINGVVHRRPIAFIDDRETGRAFAQLWLARPAHRRAGDFCAS